MKKNMPLAKKLVLFVVFSFIPNALMYGTAEENNVQTFEARDAIHRGRTPLHYATYSGQLAILQSLIKNGARTDVVDDHGNSLLHAAAASGDSNIVKTLLSKGLSPEQRNEFGETPLQKAAESDHLEVVKLLISASSRQTIQDGHLLCKAAGSQGTKVLEFLLSLKFPINRQDLDGATPMHHAVIHDNLDAIKVLILAGARTDICDSRGNSVLHTATEQNDWDTSSIVKYLLENGADINNVNRNSGVSPIDYTLDADTLVTASVLLAMGVNYNSTHVAKILVHDDFSNTIWNLLPHIFSQSPQKQLLWHAYVLQIIVPQQIDNLPSWTQTTEGRACTLIMQLPSMNQQTIPYFKEIRALLSQHAPQDIVRELCAFSSIPWREIDAELSSPLIGSNAGKRCRDENDQSARKRQRTEQEIQSHTESNNNDNEKQPAK